MREFLGDSLYRLYMAVLKLVLVIVPSLSVIMSLISKLTSQSLNHMGMISFLIMMIISLGITYLKATIVCAFWVTIVFLILKFCNVSIGEGSIEELERLVDHNKWRPNRISRVETCFEALGMILIAGLLCLYPEFIGIYRLDEGMLILETPLFNQTVLNFYNPLIISIYTFGIMVCCFKFIVGRWTLLLSIGNLIYEIGSFLLLGCLLINRSVFNQSFFTELETFMPFNIMDYWFDFVLVLLGIMAVITFFNVIAPFIKLLRSL